MTGLVNAYQEPIRPAGPPAVVINCRGTNEQLYNHIVATAQELVRTQGYTWEDMAIIYRRNSVRTSIRTILISNHIPHTVIGDVEDAHDTNAKRAINLLSTLLNPMDSSTFARAASVEPGDSKKFLNREATKTIATLASQHGLNLIESATRFLPTLKVRARTRQNLEYIVHAWHALAGLADDEKTTLRDMCHRALALVRQGQDHSYTIEADKYATRLLNLAETSFRLPKETLNQHLARFLEMIKAAAYPDLQDDENDDPFTKQFGRDPLQHPRRQGTTVEGPSGLWTPASTSYPDAPGRTGPKNSKRSRGPSTWPPQGPRTGFSTATRRAEAGDFNPSPPASSTRSTT